MSIKRMFSRVITDSTRFISLPLSSQALYFHLCQHADDDGIVEALGVIRMIGSNDDDFHILAKKGLINVLNDEYVTFIKDWLEHNTIRADRKINSVYLDLLVDVYPDAKVRRSDKRPSNVRQVSDKCPSNVSIEQNRPEQNRTEQDRLEQNRPEQNRTEQEKDPVAVADSVRSLNELIKLARDNHVPVSNEGIRDFYNQMQEDDWILYGQPVTNTLKALRGFLRYNPGYNTSMTSEQQEKAINRLDSLDIDAIEEKLIDKKKNKAPYDWESLLRGSENMHPEIVDMEMDLEVIKVARDNAVVSEKRLIEMIKTKDRFGKDTWRKYLLRNASRYLTPDLKDYLYNYEYGH